jgi:hypothetical protein
MLTVRELRLLSKYAPTLKEYTSKDQVVIESYRFRPQVNISIR